MQRSVGSLPASTRPATAMLWPLRAVVSLGYTKQISAFAVPWQSLSRQDLVLWHLVLPWCSFFKGRGGFLFPKAAVTVSGRLRLFFWMGLCPLKELLSKALCFDRQTYAAAKPWAGLVTVGNGEAPSLCTVSGKSCRHLAPRGALCVLWSGSPSQKQFIGDNGVGWSKTLLKSAVCLCTV